MTGKMRACPFCGAREPWPRAEWEPDPARPESLRRACWFECSRCLARGPRIDTPGANEREAAEAWDWREGPD